MQVTFRGGQVTVLKVIISLAMLVVVACQSDESAALRDLEKVIAQGDTYRKSFLVGTAAIRGKYDAANTDSLKWVYADRLFNEYLHFSLDSTYEYVSLMRNHGVTHEQKLKSDLAEIRVLYLKHIDKRALEMFHRVDQSEVYRAGLDKEYLSCAIALYSYLSGNVVSSRDRELYRDTLDIYRERYIAMDTVSVYGQKIHAQYLRDHGDCQRAIDIFLSCYGTEDNFHDMTSTAYNLGMLYGMTGNHDEMIRWLAKSGEHDFMAPNRDYMSIYQLALALYEDGDIQKADHYIQMNLMDVIAGGFNNRILNSGKAHAVIAEAATVAEKSKMRWMVAVIVVISMLILVLGWLLIYSRKQSRRLKESHRLLSEANSKAKERNIKLREANLIKDNYVFRYMDLSIKYLEKLEQYRHDIRQELKSKPVDVVMKELRNPSEIYAEYKKFYQIFDETFLGIFPDFREKVNELLREECRIAVPEERVLSSEQRILAVIRLGITESGKIATFLNCAPATIYTYRTKMRNAALCEKSEFEDKIRHL